MASHSRTSSKPESSLSTPPPEASASNGETSDFNIHETYTSLLRAQPSLTKPLAAISALISLLSHPAHTPSTISETLSLLSAHSEILTSSVRNPIAVKAGTDLWGRYVVGVLQAPSKGLKGKGEDFSAVLKRVIENGNVFVERAKEARQIIARTAKGFIQDGVTVLTAGRSRCVSAALHAAAEKGLQFRVIYVDYSPLSRKENGMVRELRRKSIPVAVIAPSAVAYSLSAINLVMVGAEGVLENGGMVAGLGTYQIAILARSKGKRVHVLAESHKFVRTFPMGQDDLGVQLRVLDFEGEEEAKGKGVVHEQEEEGEAVDYTPPELITSLVTEVGVLTPSAVSEELIKIWY
ncbi:MAG: hypothetical protein LQ350_000377 [Teloschistes chrysophthalmus]|nr:MAG: hypothetical protein LQ350_000377 [Niorma chrysophthalma]